MPKLPLRSHAVARPKTLGERIRYARISCNLSQGELAAAIRLQTGRKITKSLIGQWERGGIANPNNEYLLAVQASTGFSMDWLIRGRGPEKATLPAAGASTAPLDESLLARAMLAAEPGLTDASRRAKVVSALYGLLVDTPDIAPALLARFAATLAKG